jgi:hypothetical protein
VVLGATGKTFCASSPDFKLYRTNVDGVRRINSLELANLYQEKLFFASVQ